jgi:hypothetical protein
MTATPSNPVQSCQPSNAGLSDRLLAMPSSLNDACRTMEEASGEIAILQARGDLAVQNRNHWQAEAERLLKALEVQEQAWRDREEIGNESGQALVDALKARVAELENNEAAYESIIGKRTYNEVAEHIRGLEEALEQARSFARQVQYMDGVRNDHSCASVAAHYAEKFNTALQRKTGS